MGTSAGIASKMALATTSGTSSRTSSGRGWGWNYSGLRKFLGTSKSSFRARISADMSSSSSPISEKDKFKFSHLLFFERNGHLTIEIKTQAFRKVFKLDRTCNITNFSMSLTHLSKTINFQSNYSKNSKYISTSKERGRETFAIAFKWAFQTGMSSNKETSKSSINLFSSNEFWRKVPIPDWSPRRSG